MPQAVKYVASEVSDLKLGLFQLVQFCMHELSDYITVWWHSTTSDLTPYPPACREEI
jgi:hypothetical protein